MKATEDLKRTFDRPQIPTHKALGFFVRHPFFSVRHVLGKVKFSRSTAEPENNEPFEWEFPDEVVDDDTASSLMEALMESEELLLKQQVVSAAERHIDAQLIGGTDRDDGRFVRLVLRSSTHQLRLPGATERTQSVVLEPRLFLHESGAVQLTLRVETAGPLTTEQVVLLMMGSQPVAQESKFPKSLLKGVVFPDATGEWLDDESGKLTVGLVKHHQLASMTDLSMVHLIRVGAVIGHSLPQNWLNYPTAIICVGDCCKAGKWESQHNLDIEKILIRFASSQPLGSSEDERRDFSRLSNRSLFLNSSVTTYWEWDQEERAPIAELNTTLLVEYALYLFQRLEMLERHIAHLPSGSRKLRRVYRQAILVFGELRQGNLRAGDARVVAAHLLQALGGQEIRATVETGLELSGVAHAIASAERSSRRAWWLTVFGTVVAFVVAFPQIEEALRPVSNLEVDNAWAWLADPVRQVAAAGPWAVLLTIAALILAAVAAHRISQVLAALINGLSPRGYRWPTTLTFEDSPDGDSSSADNRPSKT